MRSLPLFACLLPCIAAAQSPPAAFARLKTLVGDWEAKTESGASVRVSFRLIAGDSVLVQDFRTASGKATMTVFHPDGTRLLATHYCAQGNQPRLRLDSASSADRLVFVFVDATNLSGPSASHLTRLVLTIDGSSRYSEEETYEEGGKKDVTTLRCVRVR